MTEYSIELERVELSAALHLWEPKLKGLYTDVKSVFLAMTDMSHDQEMGGCWVFLCTHVGHHLGSMKWPGKVFLR